MINNACLNMNVTLKMYKKHHFFDFFPLKIGFERCRYIFSLFDLYYIAEL